MDLLNEELKYLRKILKEKNTWEKSNEYSLVHNTYIRSVCGRKNLNWSISCEIYIQEGMGNFKCH